MEVDFEALNLSQSMGVFVGQYKYQFWAAEGWMVQLSRPPCSQSPKKSSLFLASKKGRGRYPTRVILDCIITYEPEEFHQ